MTAPPRRATCANCGRAFNCDGTGDCWCLKVDRVFDYEDMILRSGAMGCVCPVCLTGRSDLADVEATAPGPVRPRRPVRRGGRRRSRGPSA